MKIKKDLSGEHFGRWTVIQPSESDNQGKRMWLCKCECGVIKRVSNATLVNNGSKSCGCSKNNPKFSYNGERNRVYTIFKRMKSRCYTTTIKQYCDYGGRGIIICKEWLDSYEKFYDWAMLNGYSKELTIDRINNNGNYEPNNCKWSTRKEQGNNKRNNYLITIKGVTKNCSQWSEISGINRTTIKQRIIKGWNPDDVLNPIIKLRRKVFGGGK